MDKAQKIINKIHDEMDGLMDAQGNFEYPEHEGAYHALCNLEAYIDSLPEDVSEDLEEAAKDYCGAGPEWQPDRWLFIAGANWRKEKMMRDAITTVVTENYGVDKIDGEWRRVSQNKITVFPNNVSIGDKVKLIIVKEN